MPDINFSLRLYYVPRDGVVDCFPSDEVSRHFAAVCTTVREPSMIIECIGAVQYYVFRQPLDNGIFGLVTGFNSARAMNLNALFNALQRTVDEMAAEGRYIMLNETAEYSLANANLSKDNVGLSRIHDRIEDLFEQDTDIMLEDCPLNVIPRRGIIQEVGRHVSPTDVYDYNDKGDIVLFRNADYKHLSRAQQTILSLQTRITSLNKRIDELRKEIINLRLKKNNSTGVLILFCFLVALSCFFALVLNDLEKAEEECEVLERENAGMTHYIDSLLINEQRIEILSDSLETYKKMYAGIPFVVTEMHVSRTDLRIKYSSLESSVKEFAIIFIGGSAGDGSMRIDKSAHIESGIDNELAIIFTKPINIWTRGYMSYNVLLTCDKQVLASKHVVFYQ